MREQAVPHALIALLCAVFAALGAAIASIGPALPEFARVARVDVSTVGLVYTALFGGYLASQVTSTFLLERIGTRIAILWALAVLAVGTAGLAVTSTLATLLVSSAVLGAGYGFSTIGINLVASRLLPYRPAFVVNLINALYGVGTVCGPLITSVLLRQGGQARWVPAVGGLAVVLLLPWAIRVLPTADPWHAVDRPASTEAHARLPVALILIGLLVFLYGGVESGLSGWAPTYLERTLGVSPAAAALSVSLYWLAYLTGRIVSTALAFRVGPATLLRGALVVLVAGGVALALSVGHGWGTTLALVLLGGATGPIYPSMFGLVTQRFADRAAYAVSVVSTIGCVGAMLLPWVMGVTLPWRGGQVLASTPLVLAAGMWLALHLASRSFTSETGADSRTRRVRA